MRRRRGLGRLSLRQLQAICEVADHGLKISQAASALFRTQSGVTRQIQELESELGVQVFQRTRNRIIRITPQGQEIVSIARRVLNNAESLYSAAEDLTKVGEGEFTIATTHTQARYTLPQLIQQFMAAYPKVRLSLRQGTPGQCCELVATGKADLAISTETRKHYEGVVQIPCYRLNRGVITNAGHALLRKRGKLTLQDIARYPLITFDEGLLEEWKTITSAFSAQQLDPTVVLSAIDADVSKAYVEAGLGIAILTSVTFDARRDVNLRRIDARHLFEPSWLSVVVRKDSFLRGYILAFIRMFAPSLSREDLDAALSGRTLPVTRANLPIR